MERLRRAVKIRARAALDRVVRPYVNEIVESPAGHLAASDPGRQSGTAATTSEGTTSEFFHAINHELRTLELERIPRECSQALSVGAQGGWYFDWFERAVGPLDHHIGIEAYEAEPDDLPANVTWIPDTADHMQGVADGTVDLVFAGQTSEHLWAGELAGFLAESHRVLGPEGYLVLDSPNRIVTEHLMWCHGGHTIELSAAEMTELLDLAGFHVLSVRGIWRCRFGDRVMQLEDGLDDGPTVVRRIAEGGANPDDSFIWWIMARRTERAPDLAALTKRSEALFEEHWSTRVGRGFAPFPNAPSVRLEPGTTGVVGRTLPFPLHEGRWRVTVSTTGGDFDGVEGLTVRLLSPGDVLVQQSDPSTLEVRDGVATWEFEQPYLLFALSMELVAARVDRRIDIRLPIDIRLLT